MIHDIILLTLSTSSSKQPWHDEAWHDIVATKTWPTRRQSIHSTALQQQAAEAGGAYSTAVQRLTHDQGQQLEVGGSNPTENKGKQKNKGVVCRGELWVVGFRSF